MKNPYKSQTAENRAAINGNIKIPGELSQNLEIAKLAKEVGALKAQIINLQMQIDEKANRNEVTSIVAWDLSEYANGIQKDGAANLWGQIKNLLNRLFTGSTSGFANWIDSIAERVLAKLKAQGSFPPPPPPNR
jgi:hypothetical protein